MATTENKTVPTDASVGDYIAAIGDESRRDDCETLVALMAKASKHPAKMWGSGIVGFGSYHYNYDSGREGDMCLVGFSSRKDAISLYGLMAAPDYDELIETLGRHKTGKGCLYIKKLGDVDLKVLAKLIKGAAAAKRNARGEVE